MRFKPVAAAKRWIAKLSQAHHPPIREAQEVERHAGFAAALNIRGSMLQDIQRISYHAGKVPRRLSGELSGTSADLFLDLPRLEFRAGDGNRLRLHIRAWGPLTVTPAGGAPETRKVVLNASFLTGLDAGVIAPEDGVPQVVLSLGDVAPELLSLSIVPFAGGPFSQGAQDFLASPTFKLGLQLLVGQKLSAMAPSGLDAAFLGGIARESSGNRVRMLDGMVAIGIDVSTQQDGIDLVTFGDPNQLFDFSEGNDIAVSINHRTAALAFEGVEQSVAEGFAEEDATLSLYNFSTQDGHFAISGRGSATGGSVDFSLKAVPQLTRPGFSREYDELWFDMQDIQTSTSLSWWAAALATLFSIVTVGIGVFVVKSFMDATRGAVTGGFVRKEGQRQAARVQEVTLAGTIEPTIIITLERFECTQEDVFIVTTVRPQIKRARLDGERVLPADNAVNENALFFIRLPFDVHGDDPQLFVRWTVRRLDTNAIVYQDEDEAFFRQGLGLSNSFIPFLETPTFSVEVRLFRALGPAITDFLNDRLTLHILDRLDRSHPFVRWSHEVWAPQVRVESNGSKSHLGFAARGRRSKLHRTDLPGRCRMVAKFSLQQIRDPGIGVTPSKIEYLDELPFPVESLAHHRRRVCEYCFFGGPTKATPTFP